MLVKSMSDQEKGTKDLRHLETLSATHFPYHSERSTILILFPIAYVFAGFGVLDVLKSTGKKNHYGEPLP